MLIGDGPPHALWVPFSERSENDVYQHPVLTDPFRFHSPGRLEPRLAEHSEQQAGVFKAVPPGDGRPKQRTPQGTGFWR